MELLRLAKLIDVKDAWVGGDARLVQLGDILDRGAGEREILDLLDRLRVEAKAAGGEVHVVNGNHELMQTAGRFLYASNEGLRAFAEFDDGDPSLTVYPKAKRGRWAAFRPGGPYAKRLADNPIILELEGTLFVHGGLLPKHLDIGIEELNQRARDFLLGDDDKAWGFFADWDSPLNMRHFSKKPSAADCALLSETLRRTKNKRMVMGHTPQIGGVKSYCGGTAWVVDVGIGRCCGNNREALEIVGDEVKPLRYPPGPAPMIRGRPMPR